LALKEADYAALLGLLADPHGREGAAIGFGGLSCGDGFDLLPMRRIDLPDEGSYVERSGVWVRLTAPYTVRIAEAYRGGEERTLVYFHSHPFSDRAAFSGIDNDYLPELLEDFQRRRNDAVVARIVLGQREDGFSGQYWVRGSNEPREITEVSVVGVHGARTITVAHKGPQEAPLPYPDQDDPFVANVEWLGEAGQQKIRALKLGCVGAGGIGNLFIHFAVHAGVRDFVVVDDDVLESRNFNRLIGSRRDLIGTPKGDMAKRAAEAFDPTVQVRTVCARIQDPKAQAALLDRDVIVAGVDNDEARHKLLVFCARNLKPLIDMGSGIRLAKDGKTVTDKGTRLGFYIPGRSCLFCQGLLRREALTSATQRAARRAAGYIEDTGESPGSVITLNAAVASMGLDVLLGYLTGFCKSPTVIGYDELNKKLTTLHLASKQSEQCEICGVDGVEGLGTDAPAVEDEQEVKVPAPS